MQRCVKSPKEVNNLVDSGRPALIKVHTAVQRFAAGLFYKRSGFFIIIIQQQHRVHVDDVSESCNTVAASIATAVLVSQ